MLSAPALWCGDGDGARGRDPATLVSALSAGVRVAGERACAGHYLDGCPSTCVPNRVAHTDAWGLGAPAHLSSLRSGCRPGLRRAGLAGFEVAAGAIHVRLDDAVAVPPDVDVPCPARGGLLPRPLLRADPDLYAYQLRRWFGWCENNGLDPLVGIQRAHIELYIRHLGECGLMDSSVITMMHAVRGYFRFAHIDGLIPSDPAVYARLPKVHRDETRTQGLDRLELIRFLQVAQTITVHHGALAYLLGINALRASEAAAVRIEDYADTLRGHRVLHLVGKGNKPATMPLTVPVLRVLEACRGERTAGPLVLRPVSGNPIDRRDGYRMVARIAKTAGIPRHISPHSLRHAAITNALDAGVPLRDAQILARHADPRTTEHYDRARGNLDRHGVHFLTAYVAGV